MYTFISTSRYFYVHIFSLSRYLRLYTVICKTLNAQTMQMLVTHACKCKTISWAGLNIFEDTFKYDVLINILSHTPTDCNSDLLDGMCMYLLDINTHFPVLLNMYCAKRSNSNTKCIDQPAHPRRLVSDFVIRSH